LNEDFTIALPALPVNGRTTYMGYHFVHGQLLSESPMRFHPINPMTDSNLVTHLGRQTKKRIGLAPHAKVRAGSMALREYLRSQQADGVQIVIVDWISERDLEISCTAIAELPLITGSSAPAMHLPSAWQEKGWWRPAKQEALLPPFKLSGRGILIASGSCSEATRQQNAWLESCGCLTLTLDALELASVEQAWSPEVSTAISALQQGRTCLIKTSTDTDRVHRHFKQQNQTEIEIGERIVQSFAAVVREIVNACQPEGLILAGGETSSTISRVLELKALRIGPNIEPGVPVCLSIGRLAFPVVLKSGNFGSEDFYGRAIDAIRGLSCPRA
jgi:uncharacterized protein YgbK (DUF1537 family)